MTPAAYSSRSVSVVLPASTCARIPRFNVLRSTSHDLRSREALLHGHDRVAHSASLESTQWNGGVNQLIGIPASTEYARAREDARPTAHRLRAAGCLRGRAARARRTASPGRARRGRAAP